MMTPREWIESSAFAARVLVWDLPCALVVRAARATASVVLLVLVFAIGVPIIALHLGVYMLAARLFGVHDEGWHRLDPPGCARCMRKS